MAFKINPWLEKWEKKHPKTSMLIYWIVSVLVILAGVFLLFSGIEDKAVPILMICLGAAALLCTAFLRIGKR